MPLELKKGFDGGAYVEKAARRRVTDQANSKFSQQQADGLVRDFLEFNQVERYPRLVPGAPVASAPFRHFLKDTKFNVGSVAEQGLGIEEEIRQSSKNNFAILDDLQREVMAMDSILTEDEVRRNRRFTAVHYNSWVRAIDMGLDYDDSDWIKDFKTGLNFLSTNMADIMPGAGLTLPLLRKEELPVVNVVLVGEETDVGDTAYPIISSDPMNVVRASKTFRHVIIRREHNDTSRKFNHTPSYCTLLLELAHTQLLNSVDIKPLGHSPVYLDEISYINESGEEIALGATQVPSELLLTLLFEPIRTKYLKLKFRQYAPVEKTVHDTSDPRIREINRILQGSGWRQLLPQVGEQIQGRVFDFSLEQIVPSLRVYGPLGVYRSQPVSVASPASASIVSKNETISITNDNRVYGTSAVIVSGQVLEEYYLGTRLWDAAGNKVFDALVPVPDSRPLQVEYLPLFGGDSKVKLFPDMLYGANKFEVASAVLSGAGLTITTASAHGLPLVTRTDELVLVAALGETNFNVTSSNWTVTGASTVVLNDITGSATLSDFAPTPFFVIPADDADPLTVKKGANVLTIGTHYQISLDAGSTWLTSFPQGSTWSELKASAEAGRFKVRILQPDYSDFYWIEYKPLPKQKLVPSGLATLSGGRVVFDSRLKDTKGTIHTVIVNRADSTNVYLTSVVLSYFLKVREYAS